MHLLCRDHCGPLTLHIKVYLISTNVYYVFLAVRGVKAHIAEARQLDIRPGLHVAHTTVVAEYDSYGQRE